MAGRVKIPIQLKITLLTSFVSCFAASAYFYLATRLFHEDKVELVHELNASSVKGLSGSLDSLDASLKEKARLYSQLSSQPSLLEPLLVNDPDITRFVLVDAQGGEDGKPHLLYHFASTRALLPLEGILTHLSRAFADSFVAFPGQGNSALVLIRIEGENREKTSWVAAIEVSLERYLGSVRKDSLTEVWISNPQGEVLIGSPLDSWMKGTLSGSPRTQSALYESEGKAYLGAAASTSDHSMRIFSRVESAQAFEAARGFLFRSSLFLVFVVTLSIFLSAILARSLVRPVASLVEATEKISKGDYQVTLHSRSKDELGVLASAFNRMAIELGRQRSEIEQGRNELELKVKERTVDLETEKRASSEVQQTLLQTTRLATLGEMAGVTAHEVLNPLNNMGLRMETFKSKQLGLRKADLELLSQIFQAWKKAFDQGGAEGLKAELSQPGQDGKTLIEEDLANLLSIHQDLVSFFEKVDEDLKFYQAQILRVTKIVNSMRALSRVGGERRPVDIHSPLEEAILITKDLAEKRKVQVVKEFSQDSRESFVVVCDSDEMVQVFSNLLRNALDAVMEVKAERSGEIRIRSGADSQSAWVQIIDNGPGVSESVQAKLFESQVTTKESNHGTGLGLGICRRITRAFQGDVTWATRSDSKPGAVFTVQLPRKT